MTFNQKQTQFSLLLQNIYSKEEAESITEYVFQELLRVNAIELRQKKDELIPADIAEQLDLILKRLYQHEPVQYVLGIAYFYGLRFVVNQNVLIPRRETEELVELLVKQNTLPNPKILDVGTGSGCIAITAKCLIPNAEVYAIDKEENAIRTARNNALLLLQKNKEDKFVTRDIFDKSWWGSLGKFDIIVSNPPYVTDGEKEQMQPNVLDYEPEQALFVPNSDPLKYYDTIADFALEHLSPNGKLYFEINEAFGSQTQTMLHQKGYTHTQLYKDMQGKNRIVSAYIA
jgi:release factor glutamine methyltransferase